MGLLGVGFVVLIFAPTVHRRSNARSRELAETSRRDRAQELRDSPNGRSQTFTRFDTAVAVRDRLLLRGVRAEVISEQGSPVLIYHANDEATVGAVIEEVSGSDTA